MFRIEVDFTCPDCGEENCETIEHDEEKSYTDVYCFGCDTSYSIEIIITKN